MIGAAKSNEPASPASPQSLRALGRALLVPLGVAFVLGFLLLRPSAAPAPRHRPPLPTPVVLDRFVVPSVAEGVRLETGANGVRR